MPRLKKRGWVFATGEKILDKRTGRDETIKYLLKWKNSPVYDSTWMLMDNLKCPKLIEAYKREKSEGSNSTDTALSSSSKGTKNIVHVEMSNSQMAVCEVKLVKWWDK